MSVPLTTARPHVLERLIVRKAPGSATRGLMQAGSRVLPCALGRGGIVSVKREGDGGTPRGRFPLLYAMLRTDRTALRQSHFDWTAIRADQGWCDDAGHSRYNRPVPHPFPASHETLMRQDRLYDRVVVMDHNITRHLGVGGSAIFFHIAREGYEPTEGCVALSPEHMAWLWPHIGPQTVMIVR